MYATISYTTTGYETRITIKRAMSFKVMTVSTSNLNQVLRNIIINLSNAGYNVQVNDG